MQRENSKRPSKQGYKLKSKNKNELKPKRLLKKLKKRMQRPRKSQD
jgi:hypothetical protein